MNITVVWLRRAITDRDAHIDYIAEDNPRAAIEQGDRIEVQIEQLLEQPKMGRPGRIQGTRELVISRTPFITIYRYKPRSKRIEIIRLLHGSQQWPKLKS